jgi:hypothetical protein
MRLELFLQGRPFVELEDDVKRNILTKLYKTKVHYVPSLGTLGPSEQSMSFPALRNQLSSGRYAETWRNQIHWLNEGQPPEAFRQVARLVQSYLSDVEVFPPQRSRGDEPPQVIVNYRESGVDYDISAGGGGLRTLLAVAAAIELSGAQIVLFDEPDAHLFSALQRTLARLLVEQSGPSRQIIISTHAPDMIDELPIESLRWVDRRSSQASRCDEIGKTLVRLGAVSQSQAIQSLGRDVVLYFEDIPDKNTFSELMKQCGKASLVERARLVRLKGFGDVKNLPGAVRVLSALLPMKVAVAAILDADYTQLQATGSVEDRDDVLVIRLPCKELENLLLLSPVAIASAARKEADRRSARDGREPQCPTPDEIQAKIDELSQVQQVRDAIEDQWLCLWMRHHGGAVEPGLLRQARQAFQTLWSDATWRRRFCPGKKVLSLLRQWFQGAPWNLSLSNKGLFSEYQPDADLLRLFDELEKYVGRKTA